MQAITQVSQLTARDYIAIEAMKVFLEHDLNKPLDRQNGLLWVSNMSYTLAASMIDKSINHGSR